MKITLPIGCLMFILLVNGCKTNKDVITESEKINKSISIEEAKSWFDNKSLLNDRSKAIKSRFSNFVVSWKYAKSGKNSVDYVEVPLSIEKDDSIIMGFNENNKLSLLDNRKLYIVFYKDDKGSIQERIKQFYPDEKSTDKVFSGRIMLWGWDGMLQGGTRYVNGLPVAKIRPGQSTGNGKINAMVCDQYLMCVWYRTCTGPYNNYIEVQDIKVRSENGFCDYPTSWDFPFPWYDGPNCNLWQSNYSTYYTECWDDGSDGGWDPGTGGGAEGGGSGWGAHTDLYKILRGSNLGTVNLTKLNNILMQLNTNCLGKSVYDYVLTNGDGFNIMIDATINSPGAYVASTKTIKFKSESDITLDVFREEFFHGYQDLYYPGGISQYSHNGFSNIEFEAKFLRDILGIMIGGSGVSSQTVGPTNDTNYLIWLDTITSGGTKYPDSWSDISSNYFIYLNMFKQANPAYDKPTINTLHPNALINSVNSSDCPK